MSRPVVILDVDALDRYHGANKAMATPLESFVRLNGSVYIRDAPTTARHVMPLEPASPPSSIVLLSWMNASPRHVAKYISGYTARYPHARIILVMSTAADVVYRSKTTQQHRLAPVVEAIRADPQGAVLLHAFSNGGGLRTCALASAYRTTTGCLLPMRAMVLDSVPGRGTFRRSAAAFAAGLPKKWYFRLPGTFAIYAFLVLWWLQYKVTGRKNAIEKLRENLNDAKLIDVETPRCYVYSDADEMVDWKDVEEHSYDAERKGWAVTREKYEGSGHVAHARADEGRYWRAVTNLWASAILSSKN